MSEPPTVGFLHPGAMGAVLASCCTAERRRWVEAGRSADTASRANAAGLTPVPSVDELVEEADIIVSICPPASATDVAREIATTPFAGIYVDANAIAPDRAIAIGDMFEHFVDASIIGLPPTSPGTTRLYLSGPTGAAQQVRELWDGSLFDARVVSGDVGAASALKMAYAGWTKGSMALLFAVAALAEEPAASPTHFETSGR